MKSKLVRYPFNDGKRYRWDTYKMGKKFEYSWDKTPAANYETMTPYLEEEPFDSTTAMTVSYGAVGNSNITPYTTVATTVSDSGWSYYRGSTVYRDYIGINYGQYSSNLVIDNVSITSPPYRMYSITTSNYRSFGLTLAQYNWMLVNEWDANVFINNYYEANNITSGGTRQCPIGDILDETNKELSFTYQINDNKIDIYANNTKSTSITMDLSTNAYQISDNAGIMTSTYKTFTTTNVDLENTLSWYVLGNFHEGKIKKQRFTKAYCVAVPIRREYPYQLNCNVYYVSGKCWNYSGNYNVIPGSGTNVPCSEDITNSDSHDIFITQPTIVKIGTGIMVRPDNVYPQQGDGCWYKYHFAAPTASGWTYRNDGFDYGGTRRNVRYEAPNVFLSSFTWDSAALQEEYENAFYGVEPDGTYSSNLVYEYDYPYKYYYSQGLWNNQHKHFYIDLNIQPTYGGVNNYVWCDEYSTVYSPHNDNVLRLNCINKYRYKAYQSIGINKTGEYKLYAMEVSDIVGDYIPLSPIDLIGVSNILKPVVRLIGDETDDEIVISDNTHYYYTPGEFNNGQFNTKQLLTNAPSTYDTTERTGFMVNPNMPMNDWIATGIEGGIYTNTIWNEYLVYDGTNIYVDVEPPTGIEPTINQTRNPIGVEGYEILGNTLYVGLDPEDTYQDMWEYMFENNILITETISGVPVATRTWLTYNTYTTEQWQNGYHFITDQWNNIGSPYAYLSHITEQNGDRYIFFDYDICPQGNYINAFSVFGDDNFTIEDSNGNSFDASPSVFYDYLGGIGSEPPTIVSSYERHEYPDDGVVGKHYYKLKPELTKFIEYFEDNKITTDVKLDKDRYKYTHENVYYNRDTSLYNTVVGTASSTNEGSIPDATWQIFLGIYFGESIPFLGIVEQHIPPADILGVPTYDKQINTSDTLKYGTVASAATTFVLNMPVDEAMAYNSDLLILFYDFKNTDEWERLGFFYVDSVESIDEYTTRITAHDEAYKLNKYVDGFLEGYSETITLKNFFYELLDYCDCYYDTAMPNFQHSNLTLDNVYHAVKTTGTEVAHYIASIVPAFIHADIDSDIVIGQYKTVNTSIGIEDYSDLKYTAYNSDNVNKVKITANNVVIAEDSGSGENVYYLADNPLINTMWAKAALNQIANTIKTTYANIPQYRPATIKFLTLPNLTTGDAFIITTITNQTYRVLVMKVAIDGTGITIESMGTQIFPVEASSTGQFINILNDIDSVSADVSGLETAQQIMGQAINTNAENIATVSGDVSTLSGQLATLSGTVSTLSGRVGTAEGNISTLSSSIAATNTALTNLTTSIANNNSVSASNSIVAVKINNNTVNNIPQIDYLEGHTKITETNSLATISMFGESIANLATKAYVDNQVVAGNVNIRSATVSYNNNTYPVLYVGDLSTGMMMARPSSSPYIPQYIMFIKYATMIWGCEADGEWWHLVGATVNY